MNKSQVGTTRLSFVHRLRDRDGQRQWTEFHVRYGELLTRYARRRGVPPDETEEIVQEVEMYVFRAMHRFRYDARKGRFRGYLHSAVAHAVGRRAAHRARREVLLDPLLLDRLPGVTDAVDSEWEREWRLHRLRWALRSVAGEFEPLTLEAFRVHVLADRPVAETAEQLGISKASVYQAKSRVLSRLKRRIESLDPEDDPWPAMA